MSINISEYQEAILRTEYQLQFLNTRCAITKKVKLCKYLLTVQPFIFPLQLDAYIINLICKEVDQLYGIGLKLGILV